jgi:hypothetical protein
VFKVASAVAMVAQGRHAGGIAGAAGAPAFHAAPVARPPGVWCVVFVVRSRVVAEVELFAKAKMSLLEDKHESPAD